MPSNPRLQILYSRIDSEQHSFTGRFYPRLFELDSKFEQLFRSTGREMNLEQSVLMH